jgi:hypothetical protein
MNGQPFHYVALIGQTPDGGNAMVGASAPESASQTLTFSDQPENNETVTIGTKTYTFKTTITNATANQVLRGADTEASIANLAAAINRGAGDGVKYSSATIAHTQVTATSDATTLTVTAINPGQQANSIAVSDTVADATWGSSTLDGGTNAVLNTSIAAGTANIGDVDVASTVNPIPPAVSTYSPSLFQNLGADATLNVKASAGNVFSLTCHNENEAARYVQLHNTATVPTSGVTVPVFTFLVPAGSQTIIGTDFFTNAGCHFATGIAFAFSTTKDVYTAATASEQSTWVQYK